MARQDKRQERHIGKLIGDAQRELRATRLSEALRLQEEAVALCRALATRHPDDPRYPVVTAVALHRMGEMLISATRPADAIRALGESERLFWSVAGLPGVLDTAPPIADIAASRALAYTSDGRGASAVPAAEAAVRFYQKFAASGDWSQRRDLARVCSVNALVLARHGDPDLAVASADTAIRSYLSRGVTTEAFAKDPEDLMYLVRAAAIAATIHTWHGRIAVSLFPALIALEYVNPAALPPGRDPDLVKTLRAVAARVEQMPPGAQEQFGRQVLAALHQAYARSRPAPEAPADGPGDTASVLAAVGAIGALRQVAGFSRPGPPAEELTTLAGALARAGREDLGTDIVRPALDCKIVAPGGRCSPQLAPLHALRLAELAVSVLAASPADGIRIGLEAHYLFASASSRRVMAMREQFAEFGPPWARVLLACSATFEQQGHREMALDLASWAAGTARELVPLTMADPALAPLARQCFERHGQLLIAAGNRKDGEAALTTAHALRHPSAPDPG